MTAEVVVPLAVAVIAAFPAVLATVVSVRRIGEKNDVDHSRVRERIDTLTETVASAEAANLAAHERLAGEVSRVAGRFEAHATDEEDLHRRLGDWLESQGA